MQDSDVAGTVFNIQKYSVHDGPGIRTIVFFKGCPLRCRWCSNPESQFSGPELAFNAVRCLNTMKCGACMDICPRQAISVPGKNGIPEINREACRTSDCGFPCAERCHAGALNVFGRTATVGEILHEVQKEAVFYQRSSGGLTISGGEPCAQPEFLLALLREAEKSYLNTAMETCGCAPYEVLHSAASLLDTLIFDIKHTDPAIHKQHTGMDNVRILSNLRRVATEFPELNILVRTPIIPGFNDTGEAVHAVCDVVEELPGPSRITYEMLAYHRLGTQKYAQLGRRYPMENRNLPKEHMRFLLDIAGFRLKSRLVR